jgi:hypothetical protein
MSTASVSWPAVHADRVGALGLLGQLLDRISAGQKPKPPEAHAMMRRAQRQLFSNIESPGRFGATKKPRARHFVV